jgi:hypothetical protein
MQVPVCILARVGTAYTAHPRRAVLRHVVQHTLHSVAVLGAVLCVSSHTFSYSTLRLIAIAANIGSCLARHACWNTTLITALHAWRSAPTARLTLAPLALALTLLPFILTHTPHGRSLAEAHLQRAGEVHAAAYTGAGSVSRRRR